MSQQWIKLSSIPWVSRLVTMELFLVLLLSNISWPFERTQLFKRNAINTSKIITHVSLKSLIRFLIVHLLAYILNCLQSFTKVSLWNLKILFIWIFKYIGQVRWDGGMRLIVSLSFAFLAYLTDNWLIFSPSNRLCDVDKKKYFFILVGVAEKILKYKWKLIEVHKG